MNRLQSKSLMELQRFFTENKKNLENWLKYKAASSRNDAELAKAFKDYGFLTKISDFLFYIFIITSVITFFEFFNIFSPVKIALPTIFIVFNILFFLTIPSIIIALIFRNKKIRLLVNIYPLYREAPENEKREGIGEIYYYINRYSNKLKRDSEVSVHKNKIRAYETFKIALLNSIAYYFFILVVFTTFALAYNPNRNLIYEQLFIKSVTYQILFFLIFIFCNTLFVSYFFYFVYDFKLMAYFEFLLNFIIIFPVMFLELVITGTLWGNLLFFYILIIFSNPFMYLTILLFINNKLKIELIAILKFYIEDYLKINTQIKISNWNWFQKRNKINNFRLKFLKSAIEEKLIENVYLNEEDLIISRID